MVRSTAIPALLRPVVCTVFAVLLCVSALRAADPVFSLVAGSGDPPMLEDGGSWGGVVEWVIEEGPTPSFVESATGGYLQFPDESQAAIKLADSAAWLEGMPEEFTVAAWVNPKPGRPTMELLSTGADSGPDGGFRVRIVNEEVWVRAGGNSSHSYVQAPAGRLPRGSWTHVAVVVDRENVTLYLNGQQVDVAPWASAPVPPRLQHPVESYARGAYGLNIGNYGDRKSADSYPFVGDLAGVQIYDQALDSPAIGKLTDQRPD